MYITNLVKKPNHKILTSYGAMTEISFFLEPEKFLLLQALNRFAY